MKTIYLTIGFLLISFIGLSQNLLNHPESVVYDSAYQRYLVSNWEDGNIIQIDSLEQQDYFNTELLSTAGLHIVGDTLFVSSNVGKYSGIVGFSLTTGDLIYHVDIPAKQLLNDITSDLDGNLYVTDTDAHRIYKVSINNMTYTTFVNSGLGWPNGIICDLPNNRLLVLNGGLPNKPLIAVSLEDSTISTVVETGLGAIDGLTTDNYGNTYFSSWVTDKVYRYDEAFTNPPEVISSGHNNPADIFFNKLNNILAIPNFNSNSVDFIPITFTGKEEIDKTEIKISSPYPNPFTNNIYFDFHLPKKTFTKISVYDILGNRIADLVNEELDTGIHSISWNGTDNISLKPGIYFIALNTGDNLITIKIIKH